MSLKKKGLWLLCVVAIIIGFIVWWEYDRVNHFDKPDVDVFYAQLPMKVDGELYDSPQEAADAFGEAFVNKEGKDIVSHKVYITSRDRAKHLMISPGFISFKYANDHPTRINLSPFFIEQVDDKYKLFVDGNSRHSNFEHNSNKELVFMQLIHDLSYDFVVSKHRIPGVRCDFVFYLKDHGTYVGVKPRD
ncbi:hypothetical protein [Macrococcus sp. DPC7161]|uniref:hypothetical protein n=1 Tax=Macrococcus sp. DPC7161 TaxID=2507060 RepID=UPI00100AD9E7|nr:hypothetical protein [Macrococcus sp. DPC7161]RXK18335.1 hypothetical protein ER639_06490 [Macrococcus sp. DPC7161]